MSLIWSIEVFYRAEGLWIGPFYGEFYIDRLYYIWKVDLVTPIVNTITSLPYTSALWGLRMPAIGTECDGIGSFEKKYEFQYLTYKYIIGIIKIFFVKNGVNRVSWDDLALKYFFEIFDDWGPWGPFLQKIWHRNIIWHENIFLLIFDDWGPRGPFLRKIWIEKIDWCQIIFI